MDVIVDLFYNNNATTPVPDAEIAHQTQSYLSRFIQSKVGSAWAPPPGLPQWPTYGKGFDIMDISERGFESKPDPWETQGICSILLEVVMDPRNGN